MSALRTGIIETTPYRCVDRPSVTTVLPAGLSKCVGSVFTSALALCLLQVDAVRTQAPLSGLPSVPFAADASPLASSSRDGTADGSPTSGNLLTGAKTATGSSAAAAPAALQAGAGAAGSMGRTGLTAEQRCSNSLQQAAQQAVAGINAQVCSLTSVSCTDVYQSGVLDQLAQILWSHAWGRRTIRRPAHYAVASCAGQCGGDALLPAAGRGGSPGGSGRWGDGSAARAALQGGRNARCATMLIHIFLHHSEVQ